MNTLRLDESAANKMERILSGSERHKYTVRVHLPDHSVVEWQADEKPLLKWQEEDRSLWLHTGAYSHTPIMPWREGSIMLTEENKNGKPA